MLEALINEIEMVQGRKVISIIGAGGKTTIMYALAEAFATKGQNTLVTTTTHIYAPDDGSRVENLSQLRGKWGQKQYSVAGVWIKGNKLKALDARTREEYMTESDVVLIEADGAKGLPCKVPNSTEPVIVDETNIVIMVLGLDALGKRMRDVCFRLELAMDLLEEDRDHTMNEADFLTIIRNQLEVEQNMAGKKCIIVLNKCDNKKRRKQGEFLAKILEENDAYNVYLTSFRESK